MKQSGNPWTCRWSNLSGDEGLELPDPAMERRSLRGRLLVERDQVGHPARLLRGRLEGREQLVIEDPAGRYRGEQLEREVVGLHLVRLPCQRERAARRQGGGALLHQGARLRAASLAEQPLDILGEHGSDTCSPSS